MDNFNPFASYNPDSRNEQYLRQIAQLPGAEPPSAPSSRIEWYLDYILKKGPAYMKTGYFYDGQFYSDPEHTVLIDPAPGTIYIDTENNVTYRYNETTSEYESLGGVGGMVVEASTNKTVNGYQVPSLTDEQLLAIYNATVAGKAVTITDATGMMHFSGVTADMVSDEVYITFMYFNTMILEYGEGDVTTYKEIADKAYVDSAIYEVLNTEV